MSSRLSPNHQPLQPHDNRWSIETYRRNPLSGDHDRKMSSELQQKLQQHWGFSAFREPQAAIVTTLLQQRDALVIMPTGGGKSLCFQLPALLQTGLTIVVSPLVALMEDQVQGLQSRQITAACLHNQQSATDRKRTLQQLEQQQLKLLYVSPETLLSPPIWQRLCHPELAIASLIIDEAHCITQWGNTFRPIYCRLGTVRSALLATKPVGTTINLAAFTATADPDAQQQICQILQLQNPQYFIGSPYRSNLYLQVKRMFTEAQRRSQLNRFLQQQDRQSAGIVYVRTRAAAVDLATQLQRSGNQTMAYHAGLSATQRRTIEQQWMANQLQFVICTVAFGMGIDKPNVRWVMHMHAPWLLSEYLQEIGRAGRDGDPAIALTLASEPTGWFDGSDQRRWQYFRDQMKTAAAPQAVQTATPKQLASANGREFADYLKARGCRWQFLVRSFGETGFTPTCGHCDRCTRSASHTHRRPPE
jgi:ATP-dependent DNA helicase RecQ